MDLQALLDQRYREHEKGITTGSQRNYKRCIKNFSEWLGHAATTDDLTTEKVNAWLESLKGTMAESTRKAYRVAVKVCINYAYEESILRDKPRKIRKIILGHHNPVAWSHAEVAKLIEAAKKWDNWPGNRSPDFVKVMELAKEYRDADHSFAEIAREATRRGYKTERGGNWHRNTIRRMFIWYEKHKTESRQLPNFVRQSVFLTSLIATAWDTGLRTGDLLALKNSDLHRRPDGSATFRITMRKTGYPVSGRVCAWTLSLIDECLADGHERDQIWVLWGERRVLYRAIREVIADAGLTGTFKFIRRAAATEAENVRFGAGTTLLGHRGREMTVGYYIDPSKVHVDGIELPSLAPVGGDK